MRETEFVIDDLRYRMYKTKCRQACPSPGAYRGLFDSCPRAVRACFTRHACSVLGYTERLHMTPPRSVPQCSSGYQHSMEQLGTNEQTDLPKKGKDKQHAKPVVPRG